LEVLAEPKTGWTRAKETDESRCAPCPRPPFPQCIKFFLFQRFTRLFLVFRLLARRAGAE